MACVPVAKYADLLLMKSCISQCKLRFNFFFFPQFAVVCVSFLSR